MVRFDCRVCLVTIEPVTNRCPVCNTLLPAELRTGMLPGVGEDSTTQARTRDDADEGVLEIVDMMVGGTWVTGQTANVIARKHGVSAGTVKNWATAASRVIRAAIATDPEELRSRYMATLEGIAASAMSKQASTMAGELYANPDHKAAIAAISESARLAGLVVTKNQTEMRASVVQGETDLEMARAVVRALESKGQ